MRGNLTGWAGSEYMHGNAGGMLGQGHHSGLSRAHGGSGGSLDDPREGRNSHEDHRHGSHAMPKADAWREKNRLAQKAFRQRQKVGQLLPFPCMCLQHIGAGQDGSIILKRTVYYSCPTISSALCL